MSGKLISVLVFMFLLTSVSSEVVEITYVERAVETGAVCLDGSPPAYHFSNGYGLGINNWLIHLQGGGWCRSSSQCEGRKNDTTGLGSSKYIPKLHYFHGILSNKSQENPDFYDWNRIMINYCDGSSFTGAIEAVDPATQVYYRGARVFLAVMEELLLKGMIRAENAILTGCSAGGLATILHCDAFRSFFPLHARVKCVADAGYFIDIEDIAGNRVAASTYKDVVKTHGSAISLPPSCTLRMEPGLCFFPQNMVQEIQTPLFIVNSAYDSFQISHFFISTLSDPRGFWDNCTNDISNCNSTQLATLQGFRLEFINALSRVGSSKRNGYFINSCYRHCQTDSQYTWFGTNSSLLNNKVMAEAVGDWFYERSSFQIIDIVYPNGSCNSSRLNIL